MIVVGVDPGARHTGLALVEGTRLLGSRTIERDPSEPLLDVGLAHLRDVAAAIVDAVRADLPATLVAVEGLSAPGGFAGGRKQLLDPASVIATGVVLGAILGRDYGVPLVVVPAGGNGSKPLAAYPAELRPATGRGKGHDRLRHERSAYDVAKQGPRYLALAKARGTVYA